MRIVFFKNHDGKTIGVNPDHVLTIEVIDSETTRIHISGRESLKVKGHAVRVANELDGRTL